MKMTRTKTANSFYVDVDNSDDEYLYVDVIGRGTVVIKKEDEGIAVDIFGIDSRVEDIKARGQVATTWVHDNDLMEESE